MKRVGDAAVALLDHQAAGRAAGDGERLAALERTGILDTPPEPGFEELVRLAALLLDAPIAAVGLVASDRVWLKAEIGLGLREIPLDDSICVHAIRHRDGLVLADLTQDTRFRDNPMVRGMPGLRFYAAALLRSADGLALGTLFVLDTQVRPDGLSPQQRVILNTLAGQATAQIERFALLRERSRTRMLSGQVLDALADTAIITFDREERVTGWNDGARQALGWTADDMLGQTVDRVFIPEDRSNRVRRDVQDLPGPEPGAREVWRLRRDGTLLRASIESRTLQDQDGIGAGRVELLRDRNPASPAENAVPAIAWFCRSDGRIVYLDRNWYEYSGQTPDLAQRSGWIDGVHPLDLGPLRIRWRDGRRHGRPYAIEVRLRRGDGVYRWFRIRAHALRDPASGAITGWIGNIVDIEDHRNAEAVARQMSAVQERELVDRTRDRDRLWRLSSDLMMVLGRRGVILAVNPAWTDLLGWSEAELLGSSAFALLHPDDTMAGSPRNSSIKPGAIRSGGLSLRRFENRIRHRDGSWRWIRWAAIPERNALHAVGHDVTAEKAQADALRQVGDELRQSQKMEAVGQLTGGLAHDFNNLLTGISGSLDLLQIRAGQGRTGELDHYVVAAQHAASRAASLTHRLLAFSRRQTLDPKPTCINVVVVGIEDLIRRTMGTGTAVETALATDLGLVLCDQNQLENALLNLCINARDAMPDGGRLTIVTANRSLDEQEGHARDLPAGDHVMLCVTDTGVGMTADVLARAFDPFFTTKPIGQGTGLGLSMIHGFAQQSGGQVRICSEPGQGTAMRIYLPLHPNAAASGAASTPAVVFQPLGSGRTVLVVDDEAVIRALIREVLEELDFAVIEAADAAAGMERLLSDARIDLLITDVGLPGGINGRQMADAALSHRPGLKVLLVTGYADGAMPGNSPMPAGMQRLAKPFTIEALVARLGAMMASAEPQSPAKAISHL